MGPGHPVGEGRPLDHAELAQRVEELHEQYEQRRVRAVLVFFAIAVLIAGRLQHLPDPRARQRA